LNPSSLKHSQKESKKERKKDKKKERKKQTNERKKERKDKTKNLLRILPPPYFIDICDTHSMEAESIHRLLHICCCLAKRDFVFIQHHHHPPIESSSNSCKRVEIFFNKNLKITVSEKSCVFPELNPSSKKCNDNLDWIVLANTKLVLIKIELCIEFVN
jgi:hypothetical protein